MLPAVKPGAYLYAVGQGFPLRVHDAGLSEWQATGLTQLITSAATLPVINPGVLNVMRQA